MQNIRNDRAGHRADDIPKKNVRLKFYLKDFDFCFLTDDSTLIEYIEHLNHFKYTRSHARTHVSTHKHSFKSYQSINM